MPLNLETRNGEFTPYLKFNGKAGRWYTKTETGDEIEVTDMTAIFDLAQIRTGWLFFAEGAAPESTWDNGTMAAQPTPQHKRGFSVNVFSPQKLGGLRELSSSSNVAITAIKEVHAAFEAAPESKQGMVPVVTCESVLPVKSKYGTNYQPVLKITKWVKRPDAMPLAVVAHAPAAAPPQTAAAHVPPPVTKPAATAAEAGGTDEF